METLEYVQAYLDDLLCISRSSLEDHLKKLEEALRHLCNAGFKVNAEKLAFDVSCLEMYHTNVLLVHLTKVRC